MKVRIAKVGFSDNQIKITVQITTEQGMQIATFPFPQGTTLANIRFCLRTALIPYAQDETIIKQLDVLVGEEFSV